MSAAPLTSRFLDLATVIRLARLRFTTRRVVEGARMGRHASIRPGGAAEFADFRPYTPGEDLRKVDWKVLGRLSRAYVRLYRDETRLRCMLVLDASSSMDFGCDTGMSKLDYARRLLASLAFVVCSGQDEAGMVTVSAGLDTYLPPRGSPSQLRLILDELDRVTTRPETRLSLGLDALFRRETRRSVLILASDFLDDDLESIRASLRRFRHRHFEVVCLHVVHPDEETLPDLHACRFEGLESEGEIVTNPREIAAAYATRFAAFLEDVRAMAISTGCDYRRISTRQNYLQALESFLVSREAS